MVVRIDKARQHGHPREIDDRRVRGNGDIRSDLTDPRAFDQNDLIRPDHAGVWIEQAAGADGGNGRGRL